MVHFKSLTFHHVLECHNIFPSKNPVDNEGHFELNGQMLSLLCPLFLAKLGATCIYGSGFPAY
jgi:hypothetical protein